MEILVVPESQWKGAREKIVMCCNDQNLKFSAINPMQITWNVI